MLEAVKVALDPSPVQERLLLSHAGAARFVFNAALDHVQKTLEQRAAEKTYGIQDEDLTSAPWNLPALRRWWNSQKHALAPWWGDCSKEAFNHGLDSLARALDGFSKSRSGARKGARVGFPQFKARARTRAAFSYTTGAFGVADDHGVKLPRIGRVHAAENIARLVGSGKVKRVTVSRTGGRWFAALTVERETARASRRTPKRGSIVGVDLGVKTLAVLSTGEEVGNPKHLDRARKKLTAASRRYARTQKGSAGRVRAADRLARLHAHVANSRADYIHKTTTMLVERFGTVVIEDLNVAGMSKNRSLARVLGDAGFGEFRRQLTYKGVRAGTTVIVADRFYPSSKTCSKCGTVKAKLSLSERTFTCTDCGFEADRDYNAAVNLHQLSGSSPAEMAVEPRVTPDQNGPRSFAGRPRAMKPQPRTGQPGKTWTGDPATVTSRVA
jgi:putative transposase